MSTTKLVLLRHGQSIWNKENRFTGWADVGLTKEGEQEAKNAAFLIKSAGLNFDYAYCSVLKRAIKTLWIALEALDASWIPQELSWRLNERHYGALEGLNKAETAKKYGEKQVMIWRRSFGTPPPPMDNEDTRSPRYDPRYTLLEANALPKTECLGDTIDRVIPFWENVICQRIRRRETILLVSHGNTIRGLIKHLDKISDEEIMNLNIPTGVPLVYEFDENIKPTHKYFLGDPEEAQKAAELVANQLKIDG